VRDTLETQPAIHVAGTGSFALEVVEYARDAGFEVVALVEPLDPARVGTTIHGLPVVDASRPPAPGAAAVVGNGGRRGDWWAMLEPHGWGTTAIAHPAAHVSASAVVGAGCVVGPGAVVGAGAVLGDHVIVGRGALVGHHVRVGDFASLNPGANIGGNARIGARAYIGMGAIVVNGIEVGADALVAAGAVVVRPVAAGERVQGVPARLHVAGAAK
jgi:sugar O-acyltransferase (sialic acid O-acetyltransferase NeuD family)